jgi:hypothetical protein
LEVRVCGGGRPPVTERERDIHLNGTCGVILCKAWIESSIQAFFFQMQPMLNPAEAGQAVQHPTLQIRMGF